MTGISNRYIWRICLNTKNFRISLEEQTTGRQNNLQDYNIKKRRQKNNDTIKEWKLDSKRYISEQRKIIINQRE